MKSLLFITLLTFSLGNPAVAHAQTTVAVDFSQTFLVNQFSLGITHVDNSLNYPWSGNDLIAVNRAKEIVKTGFNYQNTHIMAWGASNPWPDPSTPGPTHWGQLDYRVKMAVDLGSTPIVTLAVAPWWMKGQLQPDGTTKLIPDARGEWQSYTYTQGFTDFRGITYPPGYTSPDPYASRVLDNQMEKWLLLIEKAAQRYMAAPYNVRHFQVWNELKGYYHPTDGSAKSNQWDYEDQQGSPQGFNARHGYTYFYNQTYQRLKQVATSLNIPASEVKVGGPYTVINTWSLPGAGGFPTTEPLLKNKPYGFFDQRDLDVVKYWLKNKTGGEIISIDMSNRARNNTYITNPFTGNQKFADVISWIRSLDPAIYPGSTTLPVIISEWYATPETSLDRNYHNAVRTDALIKIIKAGGAIPLLWGGVEGQKAVINPSLYTSTTESTGGAALPFANTAQTLKASINLNTSYYQTTSSTPSVSALVASGKTILVNTTATNQTVNVFDQNYTLQPYQVLFLETPSINQPASGDFDYDGDRDALDFRTLVTFFHTSNPKADLLSDGLINIFDINFLIQKLFR